MTSSIFSPQIDIDTRISRYYHVLKNLEKKEKLLNRCSHGLPGSKPLISRWQLPGSSLAAQYNKYVHVVLSVVVLKYSVVVYRYSLGKTMVWQQLGSNQPSPWQRVRTPRHNPARCTNFFFLFHSL